MVRQLELSARSSEIVVEFGDIRKEDPLEKSKEIANIIAGWFNAAVQGDGTYAGKHLSQRPTMLLVGTDPKEWLRGKAATEFLSNEARESGGRVKVNVGQVEAYKEGSVGWGIAHPTIRLPNGKQFQPRWSAVFHKERGRWKIVQIHASVGVPNEQVLG